MKIYKIRDFGYLFANIHFIMNHLVKTIRSERQHLLQLKTRTIPTCLLIAYSNMSKN